MEFLVSALKGRSTQKKFDPVELDLSLNWGSVNPSLVKTLVLVETDRRVVVGVLSQKYIRMVVKQHFRVTGKNYFVELKACLTHDITHLLRKRERFKIRILYQSSRACLIFFNFADVTNRRRSEWGRRREQTRLPPKICGLWILLIF